MSVDIEDRVSTALHEWAADVHPAPGDTAAVIARARQRQRAQRGTIVVLGAAAALVAGVLITRPARHIVRTVSAPPPTTAPGAIADPTHWVLPGWSMKYAHLAGDGSYAEFQFALQDQQLQISIYPGGTDRSQGKADGSVTVHGVHGDLTDYGGGRYRADWDEGGHVIEADGGPFADVDAFVAVVDAAQPATDAVWRQALPAGTVAPEDRAAAIDQLLEGVALPAGFDRRALDAGPAAMPYDLAADVYGHVACAWIDAWSAARSAGDTAAAQAAVDALAGSHDWRGLAATTDQGAYASVLWDLADRVVAGDATVLDAYHQSLGC